MGPHRYPCPAAEKLSFLGGSLDEGELAFGLENGELDLGHGPDPIEAGSFLEVGHGDVSGAGHGIEYLMVKHGETGV